MQVIDLEFDIAGLSGEHQRLVEIVDSLIDLLLRQVHQTDIVQRACNALVVLGLATQIEGAQPMF